MIVRAWSILNENKSKIVIKIISSSLRNFMRSYQSVNRLRLHWISAKKKSKSFATTFACHKLFIPTNQPTEQMNERMITMYPICFSWKRLYFTYLLASTISIFERIKIKTHTKLSFGVGNTNNNKIKYFTTLKYECKCECSMCGECDEELRT